MKLGIKQKMLISGAVLIGAGLVVTVFVIIPTVRDIRKIHQNVLNERIDLEKKYIRGQLLRKTLQDFEEIQPKQEILEQTAIPQDGELGFVASLEQSAQAAGATIAITLAEPETWKEGVEKLPLKITAIGTYEQLMRFWEALEHNRYYIHFSFFRLNATRGTAQSNRVISGAFEGVTYIQAKTAP